MNSSPFGLTTIMTCLIFGTNFFIYLLFQAITLATKKTDDIEKVGNKEKKLSKPFVGSLECFSNLTLELFRTGAILALTYICERHWIFDHSSKSYSRDLFIFVLILFFGYALYTIKPIKDLSLLGREQTEEWKGWMQFIFLLYHYFHAEEVYNSVRVMITCYVWMTGFGNFSFFYMKRDFGWLRVAQMMWRLNFAVLLLMWTHGNTYILYYICPMHTFYFLMVFTTMYLFSTINHTKWGIRWKLIALGVIIYIIWDINGGLFDILFAWLGTDKVIGANSGSVWEYYFRTSLDHWSTYFGMIFALNFPLAEQYFVKAKGWPLVIASVALFAATVWWFAECYTLEKYAYNLSHSYFAFIPLTAYIFFRNITPTVRSAVSMSLHDLGKTTLETYLLQHHIWLTSNAKTLLTIVPNHPWINFALATILFFVASKELYRLTMSLRGMVIPDDKNIAWRNLLGLCAVVAVAYIIANLLFLFTPSLLELGLVCIALAAMMILLISRMTGNFGDHFMYKQMSQRSILCLAALFVLGAVLLFTPVDVTSVSDSAASLAPAKGTAYIGNTPRCLNAVSDGHWIEKRCDIAGGSSLSKTGFCSTEEWVWDDKVCPVGKFSTSKLRGIFKGKKVVFVGDSEVRNTYHGFISVLDPSYKQPHDPTLKHQDFSHSPSFDSSISVKFLWAPYVANITATVAPVVDSADLLVVGVGPWDALNVRNRETYAAGLEAFSSALGGKLKASAEKATASSTRTGTATGAGTISVWLGASTIQDDLLATPEKRQFMTEKIVQEYRSAFKQSSASTVFSTVLDTTAATSGVGIESIDGVHYTKEVYEVVAQMVFNAYTLHFPHHYAGVPGSGAPFVSAAGAGAGVGAAYVPKVTGSMSFPGYGAMVLGMACVMIMLMDSFFGAGFFSLLLFGRSYDWDAAYGPLHRKILGHGGGVSGGSGGGGGGVSGSGGSDHGSGGGKADPGGYTSDGKSDGVVGVGGGTNRTSSHDLESSTAGNRDSDPLLPREANKKSDS